MFGPSPDGPLLVRAVVVAVGLAAAGVALAEPTDDPVELGLVQADDGSLDAVGGIVHESAAEAERLAPIQAMLRLLYELDVQLDPRYAACLPRRHEREAYAELMLMEGALADVEVEVEALDDGRTRAIARVRLPDDWWRERLAMLQADRQVGLVVLCEGLIGEVRVVDGDQVGIARGDEVLEAVGEPVSGIDSIPEPTRKQRRKGFVVRLRDEGAIDVMTARTPPRDDAPTCGACCHGSRAKECRDGRDG